MGALRVLTAYLLGVALMCAVAPSCAAAASVDKADSRTLVRVGVLAHRGKEICLSHWGPTADYLTSRLPGHHVVVVPLSFEEIDGAVTRDEVEFVLSNPSIDVTLKRRYNLSHMATLKNVRLGRVCTEFGGVIFCRADRRDLTSVESLCGKTFMAADETSFGGWQVAWRELKQRGIDPWQQFRELRFGGTHDSVVVAVRGGSVDAGTVRTDVLEQMAGEGKISLGEFRVFPPRGKMPLHFPFLCSTQTYPEWPMARLQHTPLDLAAKVTVALIEMPANSAAAKAAHCAGWTIPLNYQPVDDCLRELRLPPYADHDKITASKAVQEFWPWLVATVAAIASVAAIALHITRLNRKLCLALSEKNQELESRKQSESRQAQLLSWLEGVNRLHEDLLLLGTLEHKFKKITETAVELLDLDFCRIWRVGPGDLCDKGCIHAATTTGIYVCSCRDTCLHLEASAGRYTHINGNHRRVPIGDSKIGRIASGGNTKFLTNNVTTDPQVADHEWAKSLGLVSFAGYKLRDAAGKVVGVLAAFAKHPISEEDNVFLEALAETTSRVILDGQIAERLRETQRQAVEANQTKSRFLANMSHEIRTPMTAILGYTDLLMDPTTSPSARANYLAVVRRNGEHLLHLINDILDLSKVEAGQMTLDVRPCSLVPMMADVASMMRPRAEQRGDSLEVQYPHELPETILADGERLRQAVVNLVGNAVKFTENGKVRLLVSYIPDWRNEQSAVRIEVADTGIGIRQEVLPQLFQPFAQGDSAVTRKFGGSGLGLAISRHIAEALGGELTVESIVGRGSVFALTVPTGDLSNVRMLHDPAEVIKESVAIKAVVSQKELTGLRILLAEDGFDNQRLIGTVLRKAGAKVEIAENGRIAVTRAEAAQFDVILMDVNMPEMDGYEATRTLRAHGYTRPILALTANAMSEDGRRSLDAGCDDHLTKPINRTQLIQSVLKHATASGESCIAETPTAELPHSPVSTP